MSHDIEIELSTFEKIFTFFLQVSGILAINSSDNWCSCVFFSIIF